MTYYIILDNESVEVCQYDSGILGETTETSFYANKGFTRFIRIVNEYPDLLESVKILDDNNKSYTPNQFLKKIEKLQLITK